MFQHIQILQNLKDYFYLIVLMCGKQAGSQPDSEQVLNKLMAIIQLYALTSFILINKEEKAKSKMSTQKYICKVSTIFSDCILKGLVTKRPMFELMCQVKRPLCKTLNHFFPSCCQAFLVCISNMQIGPFLYPRWQAAGLF